MTSNQMREARRLLGISNMQLALRTDIPMHALYTYERTGVMPAAMHGVADRVGIVRQALEMAGVEFVESIGEAPAVRLKAAARS